jgi:hypothetical protein
VKIIVPPEADRRPEELAAVLRDLLARVGIDRTGIEGHQLARMPLDDLVSAVGDFKQP